MQGLLLVLSGVGWLLDLVLLVLDLNYWLVSSVVSLLYWTLRFILGLPGAVTLTLLQCWENACVSLASAGESCLGLVLAAVQALCNLLKGALAGLDALQLAWNLLCHVVIRSKEMMQRGVLGLALSGQNLHRQIWEAVTIGASLAAYLVNTVLNLLLIAVQSALSTVAGCWLGILNVIFASKEWIAAVCAQLFNGAMAVLIPLGVPFQMAADGLSFCSARVGGILFKHLYEVVLLLLLIWATRVVFRPSPALTFVQEKLNMVYQTLLVCLHIVLSSDVWRRVVERSVHLLRMYGAAWYRGVNRMRTRAQDAMPGGNGVHNGLGQDAMPGGNRVNNHPGQDTMQRGNRVHNPMGQDAMMGGNRVHNPMGQDAMPRGNRVPNAPGQDANLRGNRVQNPPEPNFPPARLAYHIPPRRNLTADRGQASRPSPPCGPSTSRAEGAAKEDPWKLLKQQEESRKCVICQDEAKSILLLPCRHLCLCAQCTHILLQQPILQRNCPLCRQMILQTLNVYM